MTSYLLAQVQLKYGIANHSAPNQPPLSAALDVHPRVAMAILRHSRIALTMEVYTQVPDKTTRDALKRLSDLLGGPQDAAEATAETTVSPLLSEDTVAVIGQQQVRGYDEVLGQHDRAHAIVFQKPSAQLAWGGPRSFGHDGAFGAVGCVDPDTGVSFAYTVARGPWPGGADPRAIRIAREIGQVCL